MLPRGIKYFFYFLVLSFNTLAIADKNDCDSGTLINPRNVLSCYIKKTDSLLQPREFISESKAKNNPDVTIRKYLFTSQHWLYSDHEYWQHTLKIYVPDKVNTTQALLIVDGGTEYPQSNDNTQPPTMDFASIASETHSIVAELQDIPPQYLIFGNGMPLREDDLVAYTWRRYLDDPLTNIYMPLQLPMTKAVIRAMDVVQEVAGQPIDHFVVSGQSKRGWVTWLAALSDPKERINAIIPIVIDILNTKETIHHIHDIYQDNPASYLGWPHAFKPYVDEKITNDVDSTHFENLMKMIDPYQYIQCGAHCASYVSRLNIPKYIISASGDYFFVPDSVVDFNIMPGENVFRIFPNQDHAIKIEKLQEALLIYYRTIVDATQRQKIEWKVSGNALDLTTDSQPEKIILWEAVREKYKDFRLHYYPGDPVEHVTYQSKEIATTCSSSTNCQYSMTVEKPPTGSWKAYFVEVTFKQPNGESYAVTTRGYVK